ncbi:MAG: hypothetical protein H7Y02_05910 [Candidatus Obscuribacterales bacterium]|nr:hypothetical protein [Steroidobacteraceae bacterium]
MRETRTILAALILLFAGTAHAMEGVFDRSAEIEKYIALATSGTRGELTLVAKDIYVSGLSDRRLAEAVSQRLLKDYVGIAQNQSSDIQYGRWMIKALASFGVSEYAATLSEVKKRAKVAKLRSEAGEELEQIAWHKTKNEIMATRINHKEGDNQRASQLMNLLRSDDFTYKYQAADRISWEKLVEPRILEEMSAQMLKYMDETDMNASRAQSKTLGYYAKLLGYSGEPKYRETLEKVIASKAGTLVKRRAKDALGKLN